ncbi:MAG TPA: MBL fold metallo-hydrolase [Phycisphaerales bacterium]|nr:MBL fold metallo-hydrolase [Phycisphaerales bacterium]
MNEKGAKSGTAVGGRDPTRSPRIHGFCLGPFGTNCYVVEAEPEAGGERPCWIVDASFEPGELIEHVRRQGLTLRAVVLTHAHVDHIAGLLEVRRAFPGVPIWIHRAERGWLTDPMANLSGLFGMPVTGPAPDRLLDDGDELTLGSTTWRVLHTPGHSPGGITLYHEPSRQALVGDTLFLGSIGRYDFPSSDGATLERSIRERLYSLPEDTQVYPGHGPPTTIGRERKNNPYVRA